MSSPDHPIWGVLEEHFRTPITEDERRIIIELIKKSLQQNPHYKLEEVTLTAAEVVITAGRSEEALS